MALAGGLTGRFRRIRSVRRCAFRSFSRRGVALAGCNANQPPNASAHWAFSGESAIQDPIHQAQTSGFYAGR